MSVPAAVWLFDEYGDRKEIKPMTESLADRISKQYDDPSISPRMYDLLDEVRALDRRNRELEAENADFKFEKAILKNMQSIWKDAVDQNAELKAEVKASAQLCQIYFEIAADNSSYEYVRMERDAILAREAAEGEGDDH